MRNLESKRNDSNENINININRRLDIVKEKLDSIQYQEAQNEIDQIEDAIDRLENAITSTTKLTDKYLKSKKKASDEQNLS